MVKEVRREWQRMEIATMQNGRQSALIKTYEMFENESRSVDHDSVVAIIYIVF